MKHERQQKDASRLANDSTWIGSKLKENTGRQKHVEIEQERRWWWGERRLWRGAQEPEYWTKCRNPKENEKDWRGVSSLLNEKARKKWSKDEYAEEVGVKNCTNVKRGWLWILLNLLQFNLQKITVLYGTTMNFLTNICYFNRFNLRCSLYLAILNSKSYSKDQICLKISTHLYCILVFLPFCFLCRALARHLSWPSQKNQINNFI